MKHMFEYYYQRPIICCSLEIRLFREILGIVGLVIKFQLDLKWRSVQHIYTLHL